MFEPDFTYTEIHGDLTNTCAYSVQTVTKIQNITITLDDSFMRLAGWLPAPLPHRPLLFWLHNACIPLQKASFRSFMFLRLKHVISWVWSLFLLNDEWYCVAWNHLVYLLTNASRPGLLAVLPILNIIAQVILLPQYFIFLFLWGRNTYVCEMVPS